MHAIAALNHPNICQLYDVGPNYLVLELIEGETLTGPLPIETALTYARQIADALEAAHEKGIVHRDRADIWAFGCVLYEMLTGRRLFGGDDVSETLAAVIKDEPPLDDVPERVRPLLRRCLRKDPKERLRDIGDAWALLDAGDTREIGERAAADTGKAVRRERVVLRSAVGLMTLVAAGAVAWAVRGGDAIPSAPMRFQIPPPEGVTLLLGALPSISPDGRLLAFPAAGDDGIYRIWVRALDALEARPLAGTESAGSVLGWSPDSHHVAFSTFIPGGAGQASSGAGRLVRRIDVRSGPPQTVCELASPSIAVGGSWNRDGTIVIGDANGGLLRASGDGGPCSPLTTLPPGAPEQQLFPVFLPDGRHFLYVAQAFQVEQDRPAGFYDVYVGSIDAGPGDQKRKQIMTTLQGVQYVPSGEAGGGRLLFVRDGTLFAQAFDPERLELRGEATPIVQDVGTLYANPYFSTSANGVLAYRTSASNHYQLTWLERDGRVAGRIGEPIFPSTLAVSPDGTRAAFESFANSGLSVVDLVRGTATRLGESIGVGLAWSPDRTRIAFSRMNLYQTPASGAGAEELLASSLELKSPRDWSPDGRFLLYERLSPTAGSGSDLFALPLDGDKTAFPVVQTPFNETGGRFSPDGRFIAYTSNKSGRDEVYVRPFAPPSTGAPRDAAEEWTISRGGTNTMFG